MLMQGNAMIPREEDYSIGAKLRLSTITTDWKGAQVQIRHNSSSGIIVLRGDLSYTVNMEGLRLEFFWLAVHTGNELTTGWHMSSIAAYIVPLTAEMIISDVEGVWTIRSAIAEVRIEAVGYHQATGQFRLEKDQVSLDSVETDLPA